MKSITVLNSRKIKQIVFIALILSFSTIISAQKRSVSFLGSLGIAKPLLDHGIGFQLSLNADYPISNYLSIEGQIDRTNMSITSAFLSGETYKNTSTSGLIGGRLYVNSVEKKNRFYFNILVGTHITRSSTESRYLPDTSSVFSLGGYYESGAFTTGLAVEGHSGFNFKVGLKF